MNKAPHVEPMDQYNETLVSNVHPADWKNPKPLGRYNLVVVGAGAAGLVTAAGAAGLGAKVALVEKDLLGGDCLNVGCVPSKSLIRSARAVAEVHNAAEYGVRVPDGIVIDFAAVMERMRRIRARISTHDSADRFRNLGVDVFLGEGSFSGHDRLEVAGETLRFKKAVIATGARALDPPISGLSEAGYLTNETVFNLTKLPRELLVIGGGPIGCELAQAFRRFGSEVTIVEMSPQFLAREDPDAAAILYEQFKAEGINVLLGATVESVAASEKGKSVSVTQGQTKHTLEVEEILVGAGRVPNVDGLGLEKAGVGYDSKTGVLVNDRLQTDNLNIFAAGDICMKHKFTHAADAAARIVLQNALFWGRKKLSALTIPWCTYTDPEIAHVGLSEKDARERGIPINTFKRDLNAVDRALTDGEETGFVKIHVKQGSDKIVGATIVSRHAGEMISEITVAMKGKIGLGTLANVIHPYPTQAEAIRQAGDAYNRTRLTPFLKKLFSSLLSFRR